MWPVFDWAIDYSTVPQMLGEHSTLLIQNPPTEIGIEPQNLAPSWIFCATACPEVACLGVTVEDEHAPEHLQSLWADSNKMTVAGSAHQC